MPVGIDVLLGSASPTMTVMRRHLLTLAAPVLGLTLLAGLLFLVGGTLGVIGLVRRSRWRREQAGLPPF